MHPSHIAIRNPIFIFIIVVVISLWGYMSYRQIPREAAPDIQIPLLIVTIPFPGASPEEIETGVVAKIEENLQGLADIDIVTSTCTENAASVRVTVMNYNKTDEVLQNVKNAVDKIPSFPVGMEPPIIFKQEFEEGMDLSLIHI